MSYWACAQLQLNRERLALHLLDFGGFVQLPKQRGEFERGDKVLVTKGPFEGHLGLYAGMKPHQRVEVLLALFGSKARAVELAWASIRPGLIACTSSRRSAGAHAGRCIWPEKILQTTFS